VRKRAGNGEKFLLPLQIKLAKDGDEIVYAIPKQPLSRGTAF
jgi:hypothetical protein